MRGVKDPREIWRSDDVIKAMDRAGISTALVWHGLAKEYTPACGNDMLSEEIERAKGRFYGCYTVMPGFCGSFPEGGEMIEDLKRRGMAAARMFPRSHTYLPNETVMGRCYSALEKAGILLIVDHSEIGLEALGNVLEAHPKLNILLTNTSWAFANDLMAYMRRYGNLYTDLSSMQANYIIEAMVKEFGAHRILFGSALPKMSPGAARAFIDYADISYEEKQMIAGGNLTRLCGIPLPEAKDVTLDHIAIEASKGVPMSEYVFDSHAHFIDDGENFGGGGIMMLRGDLENMSHLSDRMGVNDYCVAPWKAIWSDSKNGNKITLKMARKDKRVYPYLLIDPNYVEDIEGEAYKYHIEERFPAMKMFRSRIARRYNDPVFDPWWRIANENHLFALLDSGSYPEYLKDMEELAVKYPNVSIFLDHAGRDFNTAASYAVLAKKYENVYLQLTYTSVPEGVIEFLCKEGLAHKTLYGTDAPMRDPRPQLGWVAYADISVEDKRKILGLNMRAIADKCKIKRN